MAVRFCPRAPGAASSMAEQFPLKEKVGGSTPPRLTKSEIESEVGAALAAPAFVQTNIFVIYNSSTRNRCDKIWSMTDIDLVVKAITETLKPKKIILFGSYARGDNDKNSDFDLAVLQSKTPKNDISAFNLF